ncbi:MAG: UDP-N-acetylmuramoyl-tripeptide--D-alanyl-D-alanine ligase [Enterococcus sp.]
MEMTVQTIAEAVGSKQNSQVHVTSVEFDSRKITKGSLFVPLAGARDGHTFIQQAIDNGAVATFWSKDIHEAPTTIEVIPVEDPLQAMQELAKAYLAKTQADVIAITGSNGKTTTKDLTASVISQKFTTYKTQGNYNNNIGLPYTILHMPDKTEKIVLEMGMDHADEIRELSQMAEPKIAAITMIGEAHIENLGSREGIAKAKMEIVEGLDANGSLVIPANEPLLRPLTEELSQKVISFGIQSGDIQGVILEEGRERTVFSVNGTQMEIPLPGSYNVTNALIAYTIGQFFGLSIEEIQTGLATATLTQNRTQWLQAGNGAAILSDVYNANPTAMGLVLDTFRKLPTDGRRIAVLADMLELGPDSLNMHAQMSEHIDDKTYQAIYLYGEQMRALKQALEENYPTLNVYHFAKEEKQTLINQLVHDLLPTDSVVLKGSNGMGLMEIVNSLENMK